MFKLTGKTRKGKNRVKEHGSLWRQLKTVMRVQFSDKPGPWVLVVPADRSDDSLASRWVHLTDDIDFVVEAHA